MKDGRGEGQGGGVIRGRDRPSLGASLAGGCCLGQSRRGKSGQIFESFAVTFGFEEVGEAGIELRGEFRGQGVKGEKDGAQRFRGGWLGRASPTGAY